MATAKKRTIQKVKREIAIEELTIDVIEAAIDENERLPLTLKNSVEHERLVDIVLRCHRKKKTLHEELNNLQDELGNGTA